MVKKVCIMYFSGTGNTEVIAEFIKKAFEARNVLVDLVKAEEILKKEGNLDINDYDLLGIGYPVHAFNAPVIIYEALKKKIDKKTGTKAFVFSTCAGPLEINRYAHYRLKKYLRKNGFDIINEKQFFLSSNLILKYRDDVIKELYHASQKRADKLAEELIALEYKVNDRFKLIPVLISYIGAIEGPSAWATARDFKVSDSCTVCGKCVRSCPVGNIHIKNNKIRFKWHCMACLRCVYTCPCNAIKSRIFNFAIIKEPYDIKRILKKVVDLDYTIDKNNDKYYKSFSSYINEFKE